MCEAQAGRLVRALLGFAAMMGMATPIACDELRSGLQAIVPDDAASGGADPEETADPDEEPAVGDVGEPVDEPAQEPVGTNEPPTAVLHVGPRELVAPVRLRLDATESFDADGFIRNYRWQVRCADGAPYETEGSDRSIVEYDVAEGGGYTVTLTVVDDQGMSASITRDLSVAKLEIAQEIIAFGEAGSVEQIELGNSGSSGLTWVAAVHYVTGPGGWLDLEPAAGFCPAGQWSAIAVTADRSGLPAGEYGAEVRVTAGNVTKTVVAAIAVVAVAASVELVDFGDASSSAQVEVWNAGGGTLHYEVADSPSWVRADQASGSSAGPDDRNILNLSVDRSAMAAGDYEGQIVIRPAAGQIGSSRTIQVRMTVPSQSSSTGWAPPIGIPAPPFGIGESHAMYAGKTYAYSTGTAAYKDAGYGPYTHYVDNTHPAATDSGNPYGTVAQPRRSIPTNLPAGSVVEIHGGPYPSVPYFQASGTASQPVFVRGVGMPRLEAKLTIFQNSRQPTSYTIFEGLDLFKFEVVAPTTHVVLRGCNVHGNASSGGITMDSYEAPNQNQYLVITQNTVHDNGDWLAEYDQDIQGINLRRRTNHVWILDNEFYHNSGDGIQINAGSQAEMPYVHHIYVGRNLSHHNKQTGMWTKQATDVIFSQNTVYGHRPIGSHPSAWGAGMGLQYGPERVWFLYNHIYDCSFGISTNSTSGLGNGQDVYIVGNLIHDIHHDPSYPYNPNTAWSNAALTLVGTVNKYIINNTIYNCDAGINAPGGGSYLIHNNIIADITDPAGHHVFVEMAATAGASDLSYNLLYQTGGSTRIRWGGTTVYTLAGFKSATGKGTGCMEANPLFVNGAARDLHVRAGSPAIGAGMLCDVYGRFWDLYGLSIAVDYDGVARYANGAARCTNGAYEKP